MEFATPRLLAQTQTASTGPRTPGADLDLIVGMSARTRSLGALIPTLAWPRPPLIENSADLHAPLRGHHGVERHHEADGARAIEHPIVDLAIRPQENAAAEGETETVERFSLLLTGREARDVTGAPIPSEVEVAFAL
jgi:hypothetical protein